MATEGKKTSLDELHLGRSASKLLKETELFFEKVPVLYMNEMSPPSRAVLMTAAALEVPLNMITINVLQGDQMDPEFLKKNPQHTIPVLEEQDFCIWDSHAIAAYMVTNYGRTDELYPRDPKRRALVDQRLHFDSSMLFPALLAAIYPLMTKSETCVTEAASKKIENALEFLDKFLEDRTWLAGDTVTIADLSCIATVSSIHEIMPISAEKFPNICEWIEKCKTLPYYEESNDEGANKLGELLRSMME